MVLGVFFTWIQVFAWGAENNQYTQAEIFKKVLFFCFICLFLNINDNLHLLP